MGKVGDRVMAGGCRQLEVTLYECYQQHFMRLPLVDAKIDPMKSKVGIFSLEINRCKYIPWYIPSQCSRSSCPDPRALTSNSLASPRQGGSGRPGTASVFMQCRSRSPIG